MEKITSHPAYLNWKEYQAGKITYPEMVSRNNKLCLQSEVRVAIVEKAKEMFGAERACHDDERWES